MLSEQVGRGTTARWRNVFSCDAAPPPESRAGEGPDAWVEPLGQTYLTARPLVLSLLTSLCQ